MQNVIISGASSGIGRELALLYASKGYNVGITGRRKDQLVNIARDFPGYITYHQCDNVSETIIDDMEYLVNKLGGMDIFIHCAGIGDLNPTLDPHIENRTVSVNVVSYTRLVGWAYRYMNDAGSGKLVSISSVGGLRGNYSAPAYNATKAFQINYMEGLRNKALKDGGIVSIVDIRPGLVDTEMAKGEGLFWVAPPQKVAKQIFEDIEKCKGVSYVSRRWRSIAYLLKIMPRRIYARL